MDRALTNGEPEGENVATASHALVAVNASTPRAARVTPRPAAFLAHLIAVKEKHPQTRERRRAEPAEAIRAYLGTTAARL